VGPFFISDTLSVVLEGQNKFSLILLSANDQTVCIGAVSQNVVDQVSHYLLEHRVSQDGNVDVLFFDGEIAMHKIMRCVLNQIVQDLPFGRL
jgi:hypothetical protein